MCDSCILKFSCTPQFSTFLWWSSHFEGVTEETADLQVREPTVFVLGLLSHQGAHTQGA